MRAFFRSNITRAGRIVRAIIATALVIGGLVTKPHVIWLSIVLFVIAGFVLFEAFRGWCLLRACGIKTRL